jgi:hypothetical protein
VDLMTDVDYEQTGMIQLGNIMIARIDDDDDDQTPSVDLTLDQALSEDESVAAGPSH